EIPEIRTPLYVRDNIPVDLLASAYAEFANSLPSQPGVTRLNPSFYVESQGAFARRFAAEMAPRLGIACPVKLLEQTAFDEPIVRINTNRIDGSAFDWNEAAAWDALADYYKACKSSNQI